MLRSSFQQNQKFDGMFVFVVVVLIFSPTAESFGVSAKLDPGALWGSHPARFREVSRFRKVSFGGFLWICLFWCACFVVPFKFVCFFVGLRSVCFGFGVGGCAWLLW